MYTVLGSTKNRTLRVIWTLEELGLTYDQIKGNPGSAEIKALNPSGKVPALVVDGEVLPDSVAIMSFLSDRHDDLTFPAGSVERLRMEGHIHFCWRNSTVCSGLPRKTLSSIRQSTVPPK